MRLGYIINMRTNGLRKFLVTLVVFGVSCALLWLGKITSDNWVSLNQIVIPTFIGANLVERWMKRNDDIE